MNPIGTSQAISRTTPVTSEYAVRHYPYTVGQGVVTTTQYIHEPTGEIVAEIDSRPEMLARADRWCHYQTGKGLAFWMQWLENQGWLEGVAHDSTFHESRLGDEWLYVLVRDLEEAQLHEGAQVVRLLIDATGDGMVDM